MEGKRQLDKSIERERGREKERWWKYQQTGPPREREKRRKGGREHVWKVYWKVLCGRRGGERQAHAPSPLHNAPSPLPTFQDAGKLLQKQINTCCFGGERGRRRRKLLWKWEWKERERRKEGLPLALALIRAAAFCMEEAKRKNEASSCTSLALRGRRGAFLVHWCDMVSLSLSLSRYNQLCCGKKRRSVSCSNAKF